MLKAIKILGRSCASTLQGQILRQTTVAVTRLPPIISSRALSTKAPERVRGRPEVTSVQDVLARLQGHDGHEKEFLQAVTEVAETLTPVFKEDPSYIEDFYRICVPERIISFRVPWVDDGGAARVNRGFRVEFNSAIGPYKGGLRFHPNVTLSIIKFLGFEQVFKNSLTTLAMGGGKGGSDFDPKGKSDREIMAFTQSFMIELSRHIGPNTDVPAGDIGVGAREIGFLFGQYKRLRNEFTPVLTGKDIKWGGSLIRPEATGYGTIYFADEYLQWKGMDIKGMTATVSGSGNVSQYATEKLLDLGAIPLTMSDSSGYVLEPHGFTREGLAQMMKIKNKDHGRVSDYCEWSKTATFVAGKRPWEIKCDIAIPSATQNEIEREDAQVLVHNGCKGVFEGANMPSNKEAITIFKNNGVFFGPAKAANAGGVAVSGLEMAQGAQHMHWTRAQVDCMLKDIMIAIFNQCKKAAADYGVADDIQTGANIAGFKKVADSMRQQGMV